MQQEEGDGQEGIMIFDNTSKHLQLYNPIENTLKQMQSFNDDMKMDKAGFIVITLDDYIYVLMRQKSVYRLKYSDETATWERMTNMIYDHGLHPPATVMSGCIYVVGGNHSTYSKAVERYEPSSNKWTSLKKKKLKTIGCSIVATKEFIYSIGGYLDNQNINCVERFDVVSSTWRYVSRMQQAISSAAAVEFNGKIFVLGGFPDAGTESLLSIACFNPSTNVWSQMESQMLKPRAQFKAFEINGKIYAVGGTREIVLKTIERYNADEDFWEEVQLPKMFKMADYGSTKVKI